MIWQYFPIGFRFPVRDFSEETKRECWEIALSALFAADPKNVTLYDAQETYDFGSDGPVYLCIPCFYGIKQSRAAAKVLMSLDRLMSRLCSHNPFMQANALESFGPYPLLGKVEQAGTLHLTETGVPLLEGINPQPMQKNNGIRLLIASDGNGSEGNMRALSTVAAEQGFRVQRMQISDGGCGAIRTLVTEQNGRYETVSYSDTDGTRTSETIGILPHSIAAIDGNGKDAAILKELLQKVTDLGYRSIRICVGSESDRDCAKLALQTCNAGDVSVLSGADVMLHLIDFEAAAKQADFVLLHTPDAEGDAPKNALAELRAILKPTCLLSERPIDGAELMQNNPVLRGAFRIEKEKSMLKQTFETDVLPLVGKDVAKTQHL